MKPVSVHRVPLTATCLRGPWDTGDTVSDRDISEPQTSDAPLSLETALDWGLGELSWTLKCKYLVSHLLPQMVQNC